MTDVYLGFIAMFGFNFAPQGWAFCSGQLLSIAQNSALFALLGTTYGGDGVQTFGLPNLQSRVPIGMGTGAGLSNYTIGQSGGTENVTLLTTQMPAHTHQMMASGDTPTLNVAGGNSLATSPRSGTPMPNIYAAGFTTPVGMGSTTSQAGNNQPHSNIQPYLAINYCIALQGVFPSRN